MPCDCLEEAHRCTIPGNRFTFLRLMAEKKASDRTKQTILEANNGGSPHYVSVFLQHRRVCALKRCPHKVDRIGKGTHFSIRQSWLESKRAFTVIICVASDMSFNFYKDVKGVKGACQAWESRADCHRYYVFVFWVFWSVYYKFYCLFPPLCKKGHIHCSPSND